MIAIVAFSWGNHLQPLTVNWVLGKHSSSVLNIFEQATSAALYFQLCLGRPGGTGCMPSSLGSMARRCWTVTQCWAEVYNSTVLYFLQLNSLKSGDDLGFWRTKQRERGGKEQKWFSHFQFDKDVAGVIESKPRLDWSYFIGWKPNCSMLQMMSLQSK